MFLQFLISIPKILYKDLISSQNQFLLIYINISLSPQNIDWIKLLFTHLEREKLIIQMTKTKTRRFVSAPSKQLSFVWKNRIECFRSVMSQVHLHTSALTLSSQEPSFDVRIWQIGICHLKLEIMSAIQALIEWKIEINKSSGQTSSCRWWFWTCRYFSIVEEFSYSSIFLL